MTYIYALRCPETGRVRYVGKANDPEKRLSQHLRDVAFNGTLQKRAWIEELRQRELVPVLCILEEVDDSDWIEAERDWISHFQNQGEPLTNSPLANWPGVPRRSLCLSVPEPETVERVVENLLGDTLRNSQKGAIVVPAAVVGHWFHVREFHLSARLGVILYLLREDHTGPPGLPSAGLVGISRTLQVSLATVQAAVRGLTRLGVIRYEGANGRRGYYLDLTWEPEAPDFRLSDQAES